MKQLLFPILATWLMMATACNKKDNCNDDCMNGRCVSDTCKCDPGFTGKFCDVYISHSGGVPSSPGPSSSSTSASGNGGPGFRITFWKDFEGPPIRVSLGLNDPGREITKHYPASPGCSMEGCVTYYWSYITSGIHYTATDGTHNWEGKIIYAGECTTVKIEKP